MSFPVGPVVLLIDDDPLFIYLIERYGQVSQCRIISAPTLDTARPLIRSERPALVLLQVGSPNVADWATVRALKADAASERAIPVAVCGSLADATRMHETHATYWLSKPVMYDDFRAVLVATGALHTFVSAEEDP